jgi:hypothetical protein
MTSPGLVELKESVKAPGKAGEVALGVLLADVVVSAGECRLDEPFARLPTVCFRAKDREDAGIGDPVRQHPQVPLVVDRVEETADVGIEHPVQGTGS